MRGNTKGSPLQVMDRRVTSAKPSLLLTRPRPQAERFAEACRAVLGPIDVVISPLLRIETRDEVVDLGGFAGVVLSSENGVRALARLADVAGVSAWCVGDRTADMANALGMRAVSAGGDADDLVRLVTRVRPEGALFYAHGAEVRGNVAGRLADAGLRVQSRVVYDQVAAEFTDQARALLTAEGDVILPLFSPRTAQLAGKGAIGARARLAVVALSEAVAAGWGGPDTESFTVAARPDAPHMIEAIATIWTELTA